MIDLSNEASTITDITFDNNPCEWFHWEDIPFNRMPEDDRLWYPKVLQEGLKVMGTFTFGSWNETTLKSYHIDAVSELWSIWKNKMNHGNWSNWVFMVGRVVEGYLRVFPRLKKLEVAEYIILESLMRYKLLQLFSFNLFKLPDFNNNFLRLPTLFSVLMSWMTFFRNWIANRNTPWSLKRWTFGLFW